MRTKEALLACLLIFGLRGGMFGDGEDAGRNIRRVRDLKPDYQEDDAAVFSMPAAMAVLRGALYVVDAREGALKVFTPEGRYLKDIGRQGKGPGEFDFPSSLAVRDERIFVADTFNYRVQIFDAEGRPLGGFGLSEAPHQVLALGAGRIVVSHRSGLRAGREKLVRCYDEKGTLLGEAVDAERSSDPTYDLFRNELIIMDGGDGTFFAARKNGDRSIGHFDGAGALLGRIDAEPVRPAAKVVLPLKSGARDLTPVHWDCLYRGGRFFTLVPEFDEAGDIGPGRIVGVLDGSGRALEEIALPGPVKKILVEGERIYAFDAESALRIFEVLR
jgi:hypothetical protein